ncbi:hypothetical protein PENTCL1PPCAC_22103 [Pristionchus entomophagus]|uniref:G protein-coupled receptor n=1 Tax=Pristionchus entomophagus TaxID=358040 RepID=A0AAV5TZD8_9BILA|nr:hypothetical protein PENTCL1PPCAC_22103 [Pristionchus entomophagus]
MLALLFGTFAVFKEARLPLLIYTAISNVETASCTIGYLIDAATAFQLSGNKTEFGCAVAVVIIVESIFCCVYRSYGNLAQFIKDRETSPELPVVYRAPDLKTSSLTPPSSEFDAPPAYEEKPSTYIV